MTQQIFSTFRYIQKTIEIIYFKKIATILLLPFVFHVPERKMR
jgi:hypothetical protein